MTKVFTKPRAFYDKFERKGGPEPEATHYCPGCGHGVLHKLIAEALDDLGVRDRAILVSPVGCSVFAYYYFDCGNVQAAHGRAPAVATGIKRARPDSIVMTYQGDGDLAAIGLNNIVQAANRNELMTVFFINNALYGMTGGQMAPTTLIGQRTTTTPYGRNSDNEGFPFHMCELLSALGGPAYIERVAVTSPKQIMKARKAVRKALQCQIDGKGFSFVECLALCPTGWKMTPEAAVHWVDENLIPVFPLKTFRDDIEERAARELPHWPGDPDRIKKNVHPRAAQKPAMAPIDDVGPAMSGDGDEGGEAAPGDGKRGARRHGAKRDAAHQKSVGPTDGKRLEDEVRVKIAGFGGQGILYMGEALATAGMLRDYQVSWLPSYGPEMRGGTAHCHVILSPEPIGSPLVERSTHLLAMNRPSLERFSGEIVPGGMIVYDSSLIDVPPSRDDVTAVPIPATTTADGLGATRVANMVMLGAFLARLGDPSVEIVVHALSEAGGKAELMALNSKALAAGFALGRASLAEAPSA
jgi:2-oxoisovalerate ferredoxin oxidoreductase beta subunit